MGLVTASRSEATNGARTGARRPGSATSEQTLRLASTGGLTAATLCAAVIFHVAFPKAGFKWRGIPITIPDIVYLLLLVFAFFRFWRPFHMSRSVKVCSLLMVLGMAYFAFRIWFEQYYGYPAAWADNLAELTALCIYPLIFFALLFVVDQFRLEGVVLRVLRGSVVVVLVYGMAQKILGDYRVVIPGLTANWDDAHQPDFLIGKDNMLWGTQTLKLTSTFQNGNILAINLLLLLPLAVALCRSRRSKITVAVLGGLELTLAASRSAWAGAAFLALLVLLVNFKRIDQRLAFGVLVAVAAFVFLFYVPVGRERFTQTSNEGLMDMGGRMYPASILVQDSVIDNPDNDVQSVLWGPFRTTRKRVALSGGEAYEMFYLSLWEIGGVVGVALWLAPVAFSMMRFYRRRSDPVLRAVFLGIAAWSVAAIAEGAFWLPPTSFNLWMLIGLGWLRVTARDRLLPRASAQRLGVKLQDSWLLDLGRAGRSGRLRPLRPASVHDKSRWLR